MKEFDLDQGHQIKDEKLYHSIGNIPVLTANNEIKGYWKHSAVKKKDLPCITYPTKGNSGVCYVQTSKFDANNTAILIPKCQYRKTLDLNYISFILSKLFPKIATSKDGVSYLNKEIVEEIDLELPPKLIQTQIYNSISKIMYFKINLSTILNKIQLLKSKTLMNSYTNYQKKSIPISDLLDVMKTNSGLTEEFIYSQSNTNQKKEYMVLSGSIDFKSSPYIHKCIHPKKPDKLINVIDNKEIIHVVRKGNAGHITYFNKGKFTSNEDAYLLYKKQNTKYNIHLKWLTLDMKSKFLYYSSNSDNGTWNKTNFFDETYVDIPNFDIQQNIISYYSKLETLQFKIEQIINNIDKTLEKDII